MVPGSAPGLKAAFALASLLLLCPAWAPAQPQLDAGSSAWRLSSDRDGIALYSGRVEGSGVVPFKAVMTLPAGIEEISAVLEDAPRRGDWVARFGGSALLERVDDYDQTEYLRMTLPWPFLDRTALVRVRISVSADRGTAVIAARSTTCCARSALPELVRAEIHESSFQMRTVPGGTEVTALVFIDPKGNLPLWVVNLFTGNVARQTLFGLRRQVARKLYPPETLQALHLRILRFKAPGS
jgi:hypothetical protein